MKRIHKVLAAACLILLALCGCAGEGEPQPQTVPDVPDITDGAMQELSYPLVLKVGYSTGADDPRGLAIQYMKETIEVETDGQVLLEIYPSASLGSDDQLIAGLITREVDVTVSSAGNYALYAPRIGISALPFLFRDFPSAWRFIDSAEMTKLCAELEPYNMHVLAFFDNGFRCVTTTDRPIQNVSDMAGLNIRTPDNQIVMETMSELGANPKSYPFAQLKQALSDGEFDAQENPIPIIYNSGLYEVQQYLSITNHSYDAMPLTIRRDVWEGLTDEYRGIISKAAKAAQVMNRKQVAQQTEEYVSRLEEKGMTISYPNIGGFIDATRGVTDVFANVYGEELLRFLSTVR